MYTIKPYDCGVKLATIIKRLDTRVVKDGRFRLRMISIEDGEIHLKVRLKKAKPYCGQHSGECQIGPFGERQKRSGSWLEWDDWVQFNDLVNDVLDGLRACAEVWSVPPEKMDKGKKFYVRRGRARRVRWDWEEQQTPGQWQALRIWNHGSPDQFAETTTTAPEKLARDLSSGKTITIPKGQLRAVAEALSPTSTVNGRPWPTTGKA
jgi:hypothetical protein